MAVEVAVAVGVAVWVGVGVGAVKVTSSQFTPFVPDWQFNAGCKVNSALGGEYPPGGNSST